MIQPLTSILPLAASFLFGRGTGILVLLLLIIFLVAILLYIIHRSTRSHDVVGSSVESDWEL